MLRKTYFVEINNIHSLSALRYRQTTDRNGHPLANSANCLYESESGSVLMFTVVLSRARFVVVRVDRAWSCNSSAISTQRNSLTDRYKNEQNG